MRFVNWILVVLLSLFALAHTVKYQPALSVIDYLVSVNQTLLEIIILAVSALLVVLNILAIIGLGQKKYLKYITFNNPKGTVMVAVGALQEALTRTLLQYPQIHDAKVFIYVKANKKKPIRVIASGTLWEGNDIVGTQTKIQELLEKRFKEILKIEERVVYDVRLEKFKFEKGIEKSADEKAVGEEPTFTGIKYPIDEEEDLQ